MRVSFLIPAYNEAGTISSVIERKTTFRSSRRSPGESAFKAAVLLRVHLS